ncbi:MAG TPA: hypothetical protein VN634_02515 [Candidatus Limnocylindrales bacterium]|nr:hypothetical protein [Candidatus Limnocylindrales bacterium]
MPAAIHHDDARSADRVDAAAADASSAGSAVIPGPGPAQIGQIEIP